MSDALLSVRDLRVSFSTTTAAIPVVRGISFDLQRGEIVGLVGESGCGKSVTALALMGLLPTGTSEVQAERLRLDSRDLTSLTPREWRNTRGRELAMIFQEPGTSFDPVFTIGSQVKAAIRRCRGVGNRAAAAGTLQALESVGFQDPESIYSSYPHQLSGGMRQLVMIALAMAIRPAMMLADEPTTALDVTTQALVLDRIRQMRENLGTSVLLITHDLAVMAQVCDRAMVMYCGRIVEQSGSRALLHQPRHPYSNGLLKALPQLAPGHPEPVRSIPGQVPHALEQPPGCPFAPRCDHADDTCHTVLPLLEGRDDNRVACHHPL